MSKNESNGDELSPAQIDEFKTSMINYAKGKPIVSGRAEYVNQGTFEIYFRGLQQQFNKSTADLIAEITDAPHGKRDKGYNLLELAVKHGNSELQNYLIEQHEQSFPAGPIPELPLGNLINNTTDNKVARRAHVIKDNFAKTRQNREAEIAATMNNQLGGKPSMPRELPPPSPTKSEEVDSQQQGSEILDSVKKDGVLLAGLSHKELEGAINSLRDNKFRQKVEVTKKPNEFDQKMQRQREKAEGSGRGPS